MWLGGERCEHVASRLGIGASTMTPIIRKVSRAIGEEFSNSIKLPRTKNKLASVMNGFKAISGLPYCVGAIDGSQIRWITCPKDQKLDYRCYKGFTSVVLFGVCDAQRRFLFADVCLPGVISDSTIYNQSRLKHMIDTGQWIGSEVPNLKIGRELIRPYLIGDCAFPLSSNMMKTTSTRQQAANPTLKIWERSASSARKPIECAFGILKNRFRRLLDGFFLRNEDDISY